MKTIEPNLSGNISFVSFTLYFIFNFYDRNISNIFLIITLVLCLINYKSLYSALKTNVQLVKIIIIFTVYISVLAAYHMTPINELDNYYRFLLLLPLILITFSDDRIKILIFLSSLVGMVHAYNNGAFYGIDLYPVNVHRYAGTSSVAITYANMCATIFVICLYYILFKNDKSLVNIISALIFLILFLLTETRGPIIGIILSLVYISFAMKSYSKNNFSFGIPIIFLFIFLSSLLIIPNPIGERLKLVTELNLDNPSEITNSSIRERTYYLNFGIDKIKDNFFTGIGPQNIESIMTESLESRGIKNITARDHIHNEFLDITLKFGFISLIILSLIYLNLVKSKHVETRVLLNLLMIMLVSSQLTQSQFAHHQAITFFICLFYMLQKKNKHTA